ncbi:TonB-dependent receptor [Dasania sp. GY-MA-18]|uniref:TonB-dependent receptor n=1 Tax=Dasania phycosphaerae TaxID=2950436 RepID=A0A9J6RLU6_9GAMM|nr:MULTISPECIES: TonB-dependent receptor [Dasania]MCR8922923.1 TonB-dependent receptor [Dasania sp. GY-MA-18]MCZ0865354.1 TonB-dependent receptor [Dasania phycosphaerae]MCZ0869079.1 TonB-dependent receptor [Dasania phycosphaerae]
MRHPAGLPTTALILSFTTPLAAPFASAAGNERVEEMVVTASRTAKPLSTIPNTVTIINQADLNQQLAVNNDLSTVLGNLIPSFTPSRQKLTSAGETLRGRSPLYMVDGVPQSNPLRDGGRDGHTIDPSVIERVEVIHGANAIHGLGASGGIINLITKKPTQELQQSIRVESYFQEEDISDSLGYGLNYGFSGSAGDVDMIASLGYRNQGLAYDANDNIIGFDNTQGDTMDSETHNAFIKIGYNWDEQRLEFTANRYKVAGNNDWTSVAGSVTNGIATTAIEQKMEGDSTSNKVTLLSLNYSNENILGHQLRVQAFSQDFAGTYGGGVFASFQDPAYGSDIFDQSQNNSEKYGLKITAIKDQLAGLPINLVYGVDFFSDTTYQQLVQTGRKWVPDTEYKNYAPYLQMEFTGIEQLTVTAGIRHEKSELKVDDFTTLFSYGSQSVQGGNPEFSETLYNLGAKYSLNDNWRVFGNYSEGFSMPDVGRVLRGISEAGQQVDSFLELEPIVAQSREAGLEYGNQSITAQITYYQSESDFGQRLQLNADGQYLIKRERTEVNGVETRVQWFATQADTLGLRYAYTEGEYDSDESGSVDTDLDGANIAPNRLNLSWDRNWSAALSTRLQINHLYNRNFKDLDGVSYAKFKGYTTADLSANLESSLGTFTLGVQNLTNEDYFSYYSQTVGNDERNFKGLGRSYSIGYHRAF